MIGAGSRASPVRSETIGGNSAIASTPRAIQHYGADDFNAIARQATVERLRPDAWLHRLAGVYADLFRPLATDRDGSFHAAGRRRSLTPLRELDRHPVGSRKKHDLAIVKIHHVI